MNDGNRANLGHVDIAELGHGQEGLLALEAEHAMDDRDRDAELTRQQREEKRREK